VKTVAVTAGASAPENLVQELIQALRRRGFASFEEMEIREEDVRFSLPSDLAAPVRLTTIATL
jgi:4-hydroxy-3-methylbut-2-enyl diphosphate reductase